MSRYLLDTNTWVAHFRATNPQVTANIKVHQAEDIFLCSIVVFELSYGVQRSAEAFRQAHMTQLSRLRALHESIPFDDRAAEIAGGLRCHLAKLGTPIGPSDLLIAAIALANGLVLVTSNVKEFSRVPDLHFEDWG